MSDQEMNKLIETVTENEEYVEKIVKCQTSEELIGLLQEIDVSISEEEAKETLAIIDEKLSCDELDENDLKLVSGGGFWAIIPALKVTLAVSGAIGLGALAVGVAILYLYRFRKNK